MQKPWTFPEKETYKILFDFEIHLILAIKTDLVLINKKKKKEIVVLRIWLIQPSTE